MNNLLFNDLSQRLAGHEQKIRDMSATIELLKQGIRDFHQLVDTVANMGNIIAALNLEINDLQAAHILLGESVHSLQLKKIVNKKGQTVQTDET
jgi:archaellum component FlaC